MYLYRFCYVITEAASVRKKMCDWTVFICTDTLYRPQIPIFKFFVLPVLYLSTEYFGEHGSGCDFQSHV